MKEVGVLVGLWHGDGSKIHHVDVKGGSKGGAGCFPFAIWSDFSLVHLKMMTCINFEIMNCTIGTMKHMFNLGAIHQVWGFKIQSCLTPMSCQPENRDSKFPLTF